MNGFINLDKPCGMTSRRALDTVIRRWNVKKAGYSGTLDPFATGVLPICIGKATKLADLMSEGPKVYQAVVYLGVRTDTLDSTGKITNEIRLLSPPSIDQVLSSLQQFVGPITQKTPAYSARKSGGRRLYKIARSGLDVPEILKPVVIKQIDLNSYCYPFLDLEITCSKGTYIRTLADDIGQFLGCGAVVCSLRRIRSGPFSIDHAISLDHLLHSDGLKEVIHPIDVILKSFVHIHLNEKACVIFKNGNSVDQINFIEISSHLENTKHCAVFDIYNQFLGFGELTDDRSSGRLTLKFVRVIDIQKQELVS